tara:strand:+ start:788 stop:2140 length:1353 start_codon:yes stop_codon:yes gene_type:complete
MSNLWYPSVKQYPLTMGGMGGMVGGLNFQSVANESAWYNTLGTDTAGLERWYGVATDTDYIYTCGRSNAVGPGGTTGVVAKYDKDGVIQWQRSIGISNNDHLAGIDVDSSGNIYTGGYQTANYYGTYIKYNSSGTLQFDKDYYPTGYACLGADTLVAKKDGGTAIYQCGYITSTQGGYLIKLTDAGGYTWARQIRAPGNANLEMNAICDDSSGNIYGTGHVRIGSDHHIFTVKYNSSGTLQWARELDAGTNASGQGIATDSSDNVYVASQNHQNGNGTIHKYNSSGTLQWQKEWINVSITGVRVNSRDEVFYTGQTSSGYRIFLTKLDTSGNVDWQALWYSTDGSSNETTDRNQLSLSGRSIYYAGGTTLGTDPALLLKLPTDGDKAGVMDSGNYVYGDWLYTLEGYTLNTMTYTDSAWTPGTEQSITMNFDNLGGTGATTTLTSTTTDI